MISGDKFDSYAEDILNYLIARQDFENEFPGYESHIHGIERTAPNENGKKYFKALLIKNKKIE
jgi:lysine decarboxylase/arginine decarboxylase